MARPGSPKGVVWDVGNVIVRWDPRTLYSYRLLLGAIPPRRLIRAATRKISGPLIMSADRRSGFTPKIDHVAFSAWHSQAAQCIQRIIDPRVIFAQLLQAGVRGLEDSSVDADMVDGSRD